ncbi:MAG: hypothetical protein WB626_06290 [Bacteroidota bacterium]
MRLMILFLLSLLLSACGRDQEPAGPPPAASVILPLASGNSWTYQVISLDTAGQQHVGGMMLSVGRDTLFGGERWFGLFPGSWSANRPDGVWQREGEGAPYLFWRFPASAGDSYPVGGDSMTVLSTYQSVAVPHGVHICHVYRQGSDTYYYLAPLVGLVKMELYSPAGLTVLSLAAMTLHGPEVSGDPSAFPPPGLPGTPVFRTLE